MVKLLQRGEVDSAQVPQFKNAVGATFLGFCNYAAFQLPYHSQEVALEHVGCEFIMDFDRRNRLFSLTDRVPQSEGGEAFGQK